MAISTVLWLACAPALTASFAALVVAACVLHAKTGATAALVASAVLVLLLRFRLADAGARARILSGHSPFGCFRAPRDARGVCDQLCAWMAARAGRPAVVGSGWGWFIGRARARDAVFTHKLKGAPASFHSWPAPSCARRGGAAQGARAHLLVDAHHAAHLHRVVAGAQLPRQLGRRGQAQLVRGRARARRRPRPRSRRRAQGARWVEYAAIKPSFDTEPGRFVDRRGGV